MPLFRLNIVLSLFNRVNRFFFKEKSKALLSAKKEKRERKKKEKKFKKIPPCHRMSKPFFIWGRGVEVGQKNLL